MIEEYSDTSTGELESLQGDVNVEEPYLVVDSENESFWDDADTETITAIGGIGNGYRRFKAEMVYQWYVDGRYIKVRTLRYRMSPPSGYEPKDRANIWFQAIVNGVEILRKSDDELRQDSQWYNYSVTADFDAPTASQLRINIYVDFDGPDGGGWFWADALTHTIPLPRITLPANNTQVSNFAISVRGTTNSPAAMSVLLFKNQTLVDSVPARISGGEWTAELTKIYAPGAYRLDVKQKRIASITLNLVLLKPVIVSPAQNAVLVDQYPMLRGTGTPGARVDVHESGFGTFLGGGFNVGTNREWSGRLTTTLSLGRTYTVTALQRFSEGESLWADDRKLRMLSPPTISSPTQNQEVEMRITVSGTVNALFKEGTIQVKRDVVGTLLGTATVNTSTGAWQAQLTTDLTPGDYSLTAVHVFSGVKSLGASPVRLKVRPPRPQLTTPDPASGVNPVLTGTGGHPGATLVLSDETGEDLGSVIVTGNSWSVSPRSALTPGGYAFKVRQSISNMLSLWSNVRTFSVIVPKPTLTVPITVTDQKPSFSGMANTWAKQTQAAQVEVRLNNTQTPIVPIVNVSNNRWTSTATERWAPGTYAIVIRQLYKTLNSGWSATAVSLVIAAPLPVITRTDPEGFSPRITGTCWPGASLKLKYSDRPTVDHPVSGTNGTWTFRRDIPFVPGNHTFTVTQSYGGQTSGEAHGAFNVPTPKLGITQPEVNQEVGLKPTFEGTDGYKDAVLTIYDAISDQALGSKTLSSSGSWSLTPEAELFTGLRTVYVRQSFNNQFSARSDNRNFQVVILAPRVGVPALDGRLPRLGLISGTGGIPGALITVKLAGVTDPVADNIPVRDDGSWEVPSRLTEVGQKTLLVSQTYKGQSSEIFQHPFTLAPAAPYLESPVNGQRISSQVMASGFGYPGDTVSVHRRGGSGPHLLATTQVRPEGTWSVEFTWNAEWTGYSLSVQAKKGEFGSDNSPMHAIKTRSAAPSLAQPASQDWVDAAPTFAGHGRSGAQIRVASYFDPGDVLATGLVANGSWSVQSSKSLPPGLHRVVVWQTEGEADSVELISEPFIVE